MPDGDLVVQQAADEVRLDEAALALVPAAPGVVLVQHEAEAVDDRLQRGPVLVVQVVLGPRGGVCGD